jgi:tungstate transport system substrate-binding protein
MKRVGWLVCVMLLAACGQAPSTPFTTSSTPSSPSAASSIIEGPDETTTDPALLSTETSATSSAATETSAETATTSGAAGVLRLATTTSTADSGLLDALVPDFEQRYNADVQIVAVGTGQALKLGENGDADVVLVHARNREDEFVANGFGVNRRDVMYNDFVVVGPQADPAGVAGASSAADAFGNIAASQATFASRGDDSGTFTKEQSIWATMGVTPTAALAWYKSLGQGMGETLTTANELGAYTLSDRGTFLSQRASLPDLEILVGGDTIAQNNDKALRNPYGVIAVNPERHQAINAALAEQFIAWITSAQTQQRIGEYGQEQFGQPLFYPVAAGT